MIRITVEMDSGRRILEAEEGSLLLFVLQKHDLILPAPCGGRGTCGGCKIKSSEGEIKACQYRLAKDITLFLGKEQEAFRSVLMKEQEEKREKNKERGYGIAIDIGTTTLGFALKELKTGRMAGQWGCENSQKSFGADVASRISACETQEGLERLSDCVKGDIKKGIDQLLSQAGICRKELRQIVIVGNAAMLHILQKKSPVSLGRAPFQVPEPEGKRWTENGMDVFLFPHASAFIGGDIISGVEYLGMQESEEINFLIDLGTNGEMVLGNREKLVAAAAAAGPAFENCFRSTGTSGSRVLELLVLHVRRKTIGEDGLLKLPYRQKGIPCGQGLWITQDKIREIQLAKGAIRTGIELLMQQYGCKPEEIKNVYLAGGFGFYLNLTSAIRVGLLPEEFKDKTSAVGNTALSGAFQALGNPSYMDVAEEIRQKMDCCNLAEMQGFQEKYLEEISYISKKRR